jgi:Tfp pilus assembly protein FimV
MIAKSTTQAQLCPNCANSIREDAANCPYCKTDLSSNNAPQWLMRDDVPSERRVGSNSEGKLSITSKFIWPVAIVVVALAAFLFGAYLRSSEHLQSAQANVKQLEARDLMIQSQETQLADTRQQLKDNSSQLAEMKTKLEENQKELSEIKQRLGAATREVARLNASLAATRTASRVPDPATSFPPPAARRSAEPGVYETTRETSVHDRPSSGSPIVSYVRRGTKINVVSSTGGWLEVRSKHGNPPGYVWAADTRLISRSN